MLLYVDKKKERRKKVKILCWVFVSLFIIMANWFSFSSLLNGATSSLADYKESEKHSWFKNAGTVAVFVSENPAYPAAVVVPEINRENAFTIAMAFAQFSAEPSQLVFFDDISEKEFLSELFAKEVKKLTGKKRKIYVSSNYESMENIVYQYQLYPLVLNFQRKRNLSHQTVDYINKNFPLSKAPKDELEKEAITLEKFSKNFQNELQQLIKKEKNVNFSAYSYFQRNVSVCLSTESKTICSLHADVSLKGNIQKALANIPDDEKVKKISFLTEKKEVFSITDLKEDDGLLFRYQGRETVLLPEEIKKIKGADVFSAIKQKAGINADYQTKGMKFYRFKITEVFIDEKI